MAHKNTEIIKRFEEFGKLLCGDKHGWKKAYADHLGVSPTHVNSILTGVAGIGTKMQTRLSELGCNIDWLLTGKSKEETSFPDNVLTSYGAEPDPETLARIRKLAWWMSRATKEDAKMLEEVARKILNVNNDNDEH